MPAIAFSKELIEAYPYAKVVLSTRDVDSWYSSWRDTAIWCTNLVNSVAFVWNLDWFFRAFRRQLGTQLDRYFEGDIDGNAKRIFERHYEEIRALGLPKKRLLEFDVKEGWGPLCEFLGEEVPGEPFPSGNTVKDFQKLVRGMLTMRAVVVVLKGALFLVGLVVLVLLARGYGSVRFLGRSEL